MMVKGTATVWGGGQPCRPLHHHHSAHTSRKTNTEKSAN